MRSRVAEAENRALSMAKDAENYETRAIAHVEAEIAKARAEAARCIVDARSKREALVAEQQTEVAALVARAEAELAVQTARVDQVRLRLEAERIKSAEAERDRLVLAACGAGIVEEGEATARSLRQVSRAWSEAGPDARRIFVAPKLGILAGQMLDTVADLPIESVTMTDERLHRGGGSLAAASRRAATELQQGLGVDVRQLMDGVASSLGAKK